MSDKKNKKAETCSKNRTYNVCRYYSADGIVSSYKHLRNESSNHKRLFRFITRNRKCKIKRTDKLV